MVKTSTLRFWFLPLCLLFFLNACTRPASQSQPRCDYLGLLGDGEVELSNGILVTMQDPSVQCVVGADNAQHTVRLRFALSRERANNAREAFFAYYIRVYTADGHLVARKAFERRAEIPGRGRQAFFTDYVTLQRRVGDRRVHFIEVGLLGQDRS